MPLYLKHLSLSAVATSSSVREFSVVSADRGSESFSFQLRQNITYRDCRHDNRAAAPETLQLTMERVFVMYVKEERILRYAITNKISPVGGEWCLLFRASSPQESRAVRKQTSIKCNCSWMPSQQSLKTLTQDGNKKQPEEKH